MRIANGVEHAKQVENIGTVRPRGVKAAGMVWLAGAWMLAAGAGVAPGFAQDARTGVSRPDPAAIAASGDAGDAAGAESSPPAKPSADVPMAGGDGTATAANTPAQQGGQAGETRRVPSGASLVGRDGERNGAPDPDAGIVTYVPSLPGEVPDGTMLKVKLRESLSTLTTKPGSRFSAEVSEPVVRDGRVVVPVGAVLEGRVTWVRGGRRISGGAAIHLEARTVTLPDGSQYRLHARVIDTSSWENTKVDREGTILRRDRMKGTLAAMSLTTGGAMAAGAMIGGVPGALIGAGVGAGTSAVVWLKQDRQAELPKDLGVVFSLTAPMMVTPVSAGVARPGTGTGGGE